MVRRILGCALTRIPNSLHSESGDSNIPPAIVQIRTGVLACGYSSPSLRDSSKLSSGLRGALLESGIRF